MKRKILSSVTISNKSKYTAQSQPTESSNDELHDVTKITYFLGIHGWA